MHHTTNAKEGHAAVTLQALANSLRRNWLNGILLGLALYIVFFKNISITFNLSGASSGSTAPAVYEAASYAKPAALRAPVSTDHASILPNPIAKWDERSADDFPNLTFVLRPGYAAQLRIRPEIPEAKMGICQRYIQTYKGIAIAEMEQYGVPASITLAQALLESDAGSSELAIASNNHFGIKCKAKCLGCTCRNYADDDQYDMFRVFESPEEGFREHSILLQGERYLHLQNLNITDYRSWAQGIKAAGYATDPAYADKLIRIIEALGLSVYDQLGA